jgi:hypothetical protein
LLLQQYKYATLPTLDLPHLVGWLKDSLDMNDNITRSSGEAKIKEANEQISAHI